MHDADKVRWNAMTGGYAIHVHRNYSLKLFDLHDANIISWNLMIV